MKVKELIQILKKCKPDLDVVLQKDSEGNGYEILSNWEDNLMFIAKDGEVWRKEDCDFEYKANCVVLAP